MSNQSERASNASTQRSKQSFRWMYERISGRSHIHSFWQSRNYHFCSSNIKSNRIYHTSLQPTSIVTETEKNWPFARINRLVSFTLCVVITNSIVPSATFFAPLCTYRSLAVKRLAQHTHRTIYVNFSTFFFSIVFLKKKIKCNFYYLSLFDVLCAIAFSYSKGNIFSIHCFVCD